jgi:HEAT repeat protein
LYRLGKFTPEIIDALLKALDDPNWTIRERAALSLSRVEPATPEIAEAIRRVLAEDEDDIARYMASMSLGQLAQATPEVVDTLIKALNDEHPQVCYGSAGSLGQLGVSSPAVITALLRTIQEPRPGHNFDIAELHYSAAESLVKLSHTTPEVVYTLLKALAEYNSDWPSPTSAAELLGQPGVMSSEVLSTLQAALQDDNANIRHQAALILVQLNQTPAEAIPILSSALQQDPSRFVRRDAARFLGQISTGREPIISLLWRSLLDEHQDVRKVCPEAFAQLARRFPEQQEMMIVKLLPALTDPAFKPEPEYGFGSGQDYAHKALWRLIVGDKPAIPRCSG